MVDLTNVDRKAIAAEPRFQALHHKKSGFLWGLMIFSVVYYFLLPIGAAYFQELYKIKVWGPINVGLLFALSEFIVAWGIAFVYSRRANAAELIAMQKAQHWLGKHIEQAAPYQSISR